MEVKPSLEAVPMEEARLVMEEAQTEIVHQETASPEGIEPEKVHQKEEHQEEIKLEGAQ